MKQNKLTFLALAFGLGLASAVHGQTAITIDFQNSVIVGGDLVLTESGTGPIDDFTSDRFDELTMASFEIQSITGVGTLGITATALLDDLNVTGSGLQDGSSGYNAAGEGTGFVFDRDVKITSIDFGFFTAAGNDAVALSSGVTVVGTFADGAVSGSTDFSNTNPASMDIFVAAGDSFEIAYSSGEFWVESIGLTAVPEPSAYTLLVGIMGLGCVAFRRSIRLK